MFAYMQESNFLLFIIESLPDFEVTHKYLSKCKIYKIALEACKICVGANCHFKISCPFSCQCNKNSWKLMLD